MLLCFHFELFQVMNSTNGELQTTDDPTAVPSITPITGHQDVEVVDETKYVFFLFILKPSFLTLHLQASSSRTISSS